MSDISGNLGEYSNQRKSASERKEKKRSFLQWTIKNLLYWLEKKEVAEEEKRKKMRVVIRKVFSRSLMLSVPQSSKWVAVDARCCCPCWQTISLLSLSLSLSILFVVVIVINVLQIILGGARAFFFFIRASISFSSDM